MKLISWNVNGVRAILRKGNLQELIEEHDPDIICLQETKAHKDQVEVDLPDYEEFWNSAEKKGYSGTAVFSKIKPLNVSRGFSKDLLKKYDLVDTEGRDAASEGRVLTLEFEDFFLVNVYTPNSKRDLSRLKLRYKQWDPIFLDHLLTLKEKKQVLVCGDFNVAHKEIDLARPKQNEGEHGFTKEEREGFSKFIGAGFVDTFRDFEKSGEHYTWWTHWAKARERNVGWRIDYFLASEKLSEDITEAFILSGVMGSDHCPVGIALRI